MRTRRGWWRRLVVCATTVAMAGIAVPTATGTPSGNEKTVPVQQLSSIVEKLIREVERSTSLACPTRNSVVGKLRLLDDALLSGKRSAAQALAMAWREDAWSLAAARLIGPELGSSIQNRLRSIEGKIGIGWPAKPGPTKHWKPLPNCGTDATGVASASGDVVGTYVPSGSDPAILVKTFLKTFMGLLNLALPGVGTLLSGMVDLLWPQGSQGSTDLFQELVDESVYNLVSTDLKGLGALLDDPDTGWFKQTTDWRTYCDAHGGLDSLACITKARDSLWGSFQSKVDAFTNERVRFQQQTGDDYSDTDYRSALLPLFAQYENLYLSLLRDGIYLHRYWTDLTEVNEAWVDLDDDMAATAMTHELDPAYTNKGVADRGVGYINRIYRMWLDQQPDATQADWEVRNAYIRDQTLSVLDFRDMWKYVDPRAYPDGVPGGVKLDRMIYSDPIGIPKADPSVLPHSNAGPLREISVWTDNLTGAIWGSDLGIASVQATTPPLLGPAQSGAITGNTEQAVDRADYRNLRALSPIIRVQGLYDMNDLRPVPVWINFYFARGGYASSGSSKSLSSWVIHPAEPFDFSYDGEVLATAQAMGTTYWKSGGGPYAGAVVFGFRYADSFSAAGEAIGVGSGKCLDLPSWTNGSQAVIHSCRQPPTQNEIWTYDPGLQQISFTNPAEWSDANPTLSGKHCLDTAGQDTSAGTHVIINACDDGAVSYDADGNPVVSSQRWTIEATGAGIGKITNVKSGLVIEVPGNATADGTGLQLATYVAGATRQQWHASDPMTGEIHGIGSGRCVEVPGSSTVPHTPVDIYDCNGTPGQQWTYNPTNKEFIYAHAPSMCLEAASGAIPLAVVWISTCTGAPEQRWTLHGDGGPITNDKTQLALGIYGGSTANHSLLQLYPYPGTDSYQWSRTSTQGSVVYAVGAGGKCLDLSASTWTNGTQVVIRTCASPQSASQIWTYHPISQTYTVTSPTGPKCLDAAAGGTAAGTRAVINNCTGEASQRWARDFGTKTVVNVNSIQYKPDGTLASVMVLGVTGGATANGTTVELTPQPLDEDGNVLPPAPNQQWIWSLS